jgi:hypothetical protein
MLSEIAAWLFTLFVVDPLHAEMREHLDRARLPAEAVQQSQQCLSVQAPSLIDRAGNDPAWAVATAIGVVVGWTSPVALLDSGNPNCAVLIGLLGESGLEQEDEA